MYKATIEIEAPPSKIFEIVTNPNYVKSWQPDVVEAPTASAYVEYRLVQWGRYTRVVISAEMRPRGFLRSLSPIMKGVINRLAKWKMESRLRLLRTAGEIHA